MAETLAELAVGGENEELEKKAFALGSADLDAPVPIPTGACERHSPPAGTTAPALYWACVAGCPASVAALLRVGARARAQALAPSLEWKETALEATARLGHFSCLRTLTHFGHVEQGALASAVRHANPTCASELILAGAGPEPSLVQSCDNLATLRALLEPHSCSLASPQPSHEQQHYNHEYTDHQRSPSDGSASSAAAAAAAATGLSGEQPQHDSERQSKASADGSSLLPSSDPSYASHDAVSRSQPEYGPFVPLRPAMEQLFERALEEARKKVNTTAVGVYPYDLLMHDERVVVLAKVATAMEGYGTCESSSLTESALYAVFVCAKERAAKDCAEGKGQEWKTLIVDALIEELDVDKELIERVNCSKGPWNMLIDVLAEVALWGRHFAAKRTIFLDKSPLRQRKMYSAIGDVDQWFQSRPALPTEAELADAERKVAALTPKGREVMQGLFPAGHFAAKMSMRQLVFSVEGGACAACGLDACPRCQREERREEKRSAKGKLSSNGYLNAKTLANGTTAAIAEVAAGTNGTSSTLSNAAYGLAGSSFSFSQNSDMVLSEAAWEVLCSQEKEICAFFSNLSHSERRNGLKLPARELDRSMALSREWDVLVSAELEYDYSNPESNPVVVYHSSQDAFYPGSMLIDPVRGSHALLASLDPSRFRQAEFWRNFCNNTNGAAVCIAQSCEERSNACVREALFPTNDNSEIDSASKASAGKGSTLSVFSRGLLELHFTRLFAVRLLARFGEAAKEAAAQAALESLLKDEEEQRGTNSQQAATDSANSGKKRNRRRRKRSGRGNNAQTRECEQDERNGHHDDRGEQKEDQAAVQTAATSTTSEDQVNPGDTQAGEEATEKCASQASQAHQFVHQHGREELSTLDPPSEQVAHSPPEQNSREEWKNENRRRRRTKRGKPAGRGKNNNANHQENSANAPAVLSSEAPQTDAEEAALVRKAIQESLREEEHHKQQRPEPGSDPALMPAMPMPSKRPSKQQFQQQPPLHSSSPSPSASPSPQQQYQKQAAASTQPNQQVVRPASQPPTLFNDAHVPPAPPAPAEAFWAQEASPAHQNPWTQQGPRHISQEQQSAASNALRTKQHQSDNSRVLHQPNQHADSLLHELTGLDLDADAGSHQQAQDPVSPSAARQQQSQSSRGSPLHGSLLTSDIGSAFGGGLFTSNLTGGALSGEHQQQQSLNVNAPAWWRPRQ